MDDIASEYPKIINALSENKPLEHTFKTNSNILLFSIKTRWRAALEINLSPAGAVLQTNFKSSNQSCIHFSHAIQTDFTVLWRPPSTSGAQGQINKFCYRYSLINNPSTALLWWWFLPVPCLGENLRWFSANKHTLCFSCSHNPAELIHKPSEPFFLTQGGREASPAHSPLFRFSSENHTPQLSVSFGVSAWLVLML